MAVKEHSKRKHAKFAPSASERWIKCPRSVKLSEGVPPQVEGPYAEEGTRAHECLEFIVKRYSNLAQAKQIAARKTRVDKKTGETVPMWDEAMIEYAELSAHTIMKLRPSPTAKLMIETRSQMSDEVYGSLDYAWVDEWGELIIIDYKYGAGIPVLPIDDETGEENYQLMCYAVGVAKKFNYEFNTVKLAIIQPRVWKDDENPLSIGTTSIKRLREFEKLADKKVAEAKSPNATLKAGEHCRWCPAAIKCPEVSSARMKDVGLEFDAEGEITLPEVNLLPVSNLGKILKACDLIEVWISKVRAFAEASAYKGEKIEGYKLVEKRSTRRYTEGAEAGAELFFGDDIYEKKLLSPAQLEKRFGKEAKSFTKEFTTNESSGYTLVKSSDKRPEVEIAHGFEIEESN